MSRSGGIPPGRQYCNFNISLLGNVISLSALDHYVLDHSLLMVTLQSIGGVGLLPEPLPLPPCKGPSAVRISSAIASRRQQMIGTGSDTVARFRCDPETTLEVSCEVGARL